MRGWMGMNEPLIGSWICASLLHQIFNDNCHCLATNGWTTPEWLHSAIRSGLINGVCLLPLIQLIATVLSLFDWNVECHDGLPTPAALNSTEYLVLAEFTIAFISYAYTNAYMTSIWCEDSEQMRVQFEMFHSCDLPLHQSICLLFAHSTGIFWTADSAVSPWFMVVARCERIVHLIGWKHFFWSKVCTGQNYS